MDVFSSERFVVLACIKFLKNLLVESRSSKVSNFVDSVLQQIGQSITDLLIQGISGRYELSMTGYLSDLLYNLVCKYPRLMRVWINSSLTNDSIFFKRLDFKDKKMFVDGTLGNRNVKRFRDVVKNFGIIFHHISSKIGPIPPPRRKA